MRGTIESEAGVEAMRIEVIALLERHATYYRVRCKTVQEGVCQDLLQAVMAIGRGEGQGDALTARAVTATTLPEQTATQPRARADIRHAGTLR